MTGSPLNAQADLINYTVTDTVSGNPALTGSFSYDTITMMIPALDLILKATPVTGPDEEFVFDQTVVSNLTPTSFVLDDFITITFPLGTIPSPANNMLEYTFRFPDDYGFAIHNSTVTAIGSTVPEPGTALLLATGLFGLAAYRWKQHHRQQAKNHL